jgi:16S rRNA (cytidine1402-2'-O)-methyltransferase
MMKGKLYLIPTPLGDNSPAITLPQYNTEIIKNLKHFIVEEERTARRFLKKILPEININELCFSLLNEHTKEHEVIDYLKPIAENSIGLISEAGVPCVADPGNVIVKMAHEKGIEVVPLTGPSSIILALMASGFNGQNFAFNGYLPIQKDERIKALKTYERRSYAEKQTQIFIEAPYRNNQLISDIVSACNPDTYLCVACDISLETQVIATKKIKDWKTKLPDIHKRPAILLIYGF